MQEVEVGGAAALSMTKEEGERRMCHTKKTRIPNLDEVVEVAGDTGDDRHRVLHQQIAVVEHYIRIPTRDQHAIVDGLSGYHDNHDTNDRNIGK